MALLNLIIGRATDDFKAAPTVVYLGEDKVAAQAGVDASPLPRHELHYLQFHRVMRRTGNAPAPTVVEVDANEVPREALLEALEAAQRENQGLLSRIDEMNTGGQKTFDQQKERIALLEGQIADLSTALTAAAGRIAELKQLSGNPPAVAAEVGNAAPSAAPSAEAQSDLPETVGAPPRTDTGDFTVNPPGTPIDLIRPADSKADVAEPDEPTHPRRNRR